MEAEFDDFERETGEHQTPCTPRRRPPPINFMHNMQETPHPPASNRDILRPSIEEPLVQQSTNSPDRIIDTQMQNSEPPSTQLRIKAEDSDRQRSIPAAELPPIASGNGESALTSKDNNDSSIIPDAQSVPSTASPEMVPNAGSSTSTEPISSIFDGPESSGAPVKSIFGGPTQVKPPQKAVEPAISPHRSVSSVIVTPHDDDEDDFMIIEHDQASQDAQRRWSSQPSPRTRSVDDDVLFVKEEPRDAPINSLPTRTSPSRNHLDTARPAKATPLLPQKKMDTNKLLAAQQAMLNRGRAATNRNGQSSRDHSRKFPHAQDFEGFDNAAFPNDADHMDKTLYHEDDEWMNERDDHDESYDKLIRLRDLLTKMEKNGTISAEDAMELFKVKRDIAAKDRRRAAASFGDPEDRDGEDSLFMPAETTEQVIQRHRRDRPRPSHKSLVDASEDNSDLTDTHARDDGVDVGDDTLARALENALSKDNGDADPTLTKAGNPRKKRTKGPSTARDFHEQQWTLRREKERTKAQKKKARQPAPSTASRRKAAAVTRGGKGKAKAKPAAKNAAAKGKGKSVVRNGASLNRSHNLKSSNGEDAVGQMMLEDLMNNDPISERLEDPIFDRPAEPTISGPQRKATQFQVLFANIPTAENQSQMGAIKSDKARLRYASRSFGNSKCKAQDGKWLIKGMRSPLYHHQLLGAEWMVLRELSSQPPHGGLLADSMGLGKTVQTLACMVANPPTVADTHRNVKATLIVVPAGVLTQWMEEIRLHVDKNVFPKIQAYKSSANMTLEVLQDIDIVVTSYNEVMRQFPFPDKQGRVDIARVGYKRWWKKAIENMGILHQINWYRVVLDEAQAIKNNSARTSLACQNLKSVYRWCLTGTPLLNKLEELFPYLRFLKANYSMDWQTFQKYFCDPQAEISYARISTLLSYTMMRRTMKTTILNRPIITLPRPHPKILYVQFSPEEQIIYRITENRFRNNLNTFFKRGEASRNYGVFMVQLLRLRQCTSHPFMLERTIKESWTTEDVHELKNQLGKIRNRGRKPFYDQCEAWVEQTLARREAARERGEEDDEMMPFGRNDYGHNFDFDGALGNLNEKELEKELFERVTCTICADVPTNPVETDCGHMFCEDCLDTYMHELVADDENDYMTCPQCNRVFNTHNRVPNPAAIDEDDNADRSNPGSSRSAGRSKKPLGHSGSKGRDELGFEPATPTDATWVTKSDHDPDFPLAPSSKTTALKALLLKGFEDAPLDKVVIYVQFRTLARIVGRICESEGWGFLYLTGDSSLEHRHKAIQKFRDDGNCKIFIAGLKCGGLGLNFPWANRCISLDLWWNHAVEQQAFGRIFRIGQEKETYMTRIVVKNTVDMRMLNMQLQKLQNLEKAMKDGQERESPNLSLKQLANLFGFLKTDADDKIVSVEADYVDEAGRPEAEFGDSGADGQERGEDNGEGSSRGNGGGGGGSGGYVYGGYGKQMDVDEAIARDL